MHFLKRRPKFEVGIEQSPLLISFDLHFATELKEQKSFLKENKEEDPFDPIIADIAAKLGAIASIWNSVGSSIFFVT